MITLADMVANSTLSPDGAELLATIGSEGRSFLVYALPRNAGKSTLMQAILATAVPQHPLRQFFGTEAERSTLAGMQPEGYLVVSEIGHSGMRGYLSQAEVRRLFDLVERGYSLASSLHADTVEEVFAVLEQNGVDASAASEIEFMIKVRALGPTRDPGTRRVVESVHQIDRHLGAEPSHILLYRWDGEDRFESIATPLPRP